MEKVCRIVFYGPLGAGKATCVETYQNYKIDGSPTKETFTFSPGSESKKVKSFKEDE